MTVTCNYEDWSTRSIPTVVPGSFGGPSPSWTQNDGPGSSTLSISGNKVTLAGLSGSSASFGQTVLSTDSQFAGLANPIDIEFTFSMTEPTADQNSKCRVTFAVGWVGGPELGGGIEVTVMCYYNNITAAYESHLLVRNNGTLNTQIFAGNLWADGADHTIVIQQGGYFRNVTLEGESYYTGAYAGSLSTATDEISFFISLENLSGYNEGRDHTEDETLTAGLIVLPDSDFCVTVFPGPCYCPPYVPSASAPLQGQPVEDEFIATGDGTTTDFYTDWPYHPQSLEVEVDGISAAADPSDPSIGKFTLPFTPLAGEAIYASYLGA